MLSIYAAACGYSNASIFSDYPIISDICLFLSFALPTFLQLEGAC